MSTWINLLEIVYPVGSLYMSSTNKSPAEMIGGTWEKIETAVIAAADGDLVNPGQYNGSLKISTSQLPSHTHPMDLYKKLLGTEGGAWRVFWDSRDPDSEGSTPATTVLNTRATGSGADFLPRSFGVFVWRRIA